MKREQEQMDKPLMYTSFSVLPMENNLMSAQHQFIVFTISHKLIVRPLKATSNLASYVLENNLEWAEAWQWAFGRRRGPARAALRLQWAGIAGSYSGHRWAGAD
jgi:hypothetical protein